MPITFTQFGGYTGSHSGDCAVLSVDSQKYCVIDAGHHAQGRNGIRSVCGLWPKKDFTVQGLKDRNIPEELVLVISHFHDDHIAQDKAWQTYKRLNATLYCGQTADRKGDESYQKALQKFANLTIVNQPRLVFSAHSEEGFDVTVRSVGSELDGLENPTENDACLGSVIQISKDDELVWSCLSLGDMTPRAGDQRISDLCDELGFQPNAGLGFDCVKLSHHGSSNNLLSVLDRSIKNNTVVLISGYSGMGPETVIKRLKKWKPKESYLLFDKSIDINMTLGQTKKSLEDVGMQIRFQYQFTIPDGWQGFE